MRAPRTALGLAVLLLLALALAAWTIWEARRQREDVASALASEATVLAAALAPGLAAASDAEREVDEAIASRLLDDARLLAELARERVPGTDRLRRIADASELDSIAFLDAGGAIRSAVGDEISPGLVARLADLLAGRADEELLGFSPAADPMHRGAAARLESGGAVLVRVHAASAYAFARSLGVDNLLERLVASPGVLYLGYREEPGPVTAEAAWDGAPLPPPPAAGEELRPLRGVLAFEALVPVVTPAGRRATLRVGLDGAPLARASLAASRRTALIGVVLAGFGLAGAAFALVSRQRAREREATGRRLAELEESRRSSERLAFAGTLTAGLAHEVRSPLNSIGLAAQRLERSQAGSAVGETARLIRSEVLRLDGVLRDFLALARPASERRDPADVAEIAREVAALLADEAAEAGVAFAPVEGSAIAPLDRDAVRRAILNLARNAIEASPRGGTVELRVEPVGDERVRLRVLDEGPGPDPALGERVLEPFVTSRPDGTGLGLALVRRVVEEHGGSFRLGARRPRGAEALLELPAARSAAPRRDAVPVEDGG